MPSPLATLEMGPDRGQEREGQGTGKRAGVLGRYGRPVHPVVRLSLKVPMRFSRKGANSTVVPTLLTHSGAVAKADVSNEELCPFSPPCTVLALITSDYKAPAQT